MNYHFKPEGKKEELLQQLRDLDNGIQQDNKSLERLKLEAEFYEDKNKNTVNKESLADQIMKELMNDPMKDKYLPQQQLRKKPETIPPPQYKPAQFRQMPPPEVARQNNFINQRELQKNKLQNQKHQGLFPNSSDHQRIRSYGKQVVPEQDKHVSPRGNFNPNSPKKHQSPQYRYDPSYNPFVKDDAEERQRKEEKNREYLRALEQQRLEHERQRKNRIKEEKDIKVQIFNDYQPQSKAVQIEKPLVMKKNDPNSKPPKIESVMGNYSQFDKNLIKSKVIELRVKFKKGKINFEEYEREFSNFQKQYPGDPDELNEQENIQNKKDSPVNQKIESPKKYNDDHQKYVLKESEEPKNEPLNFPIKNESINYSQFMPSMVQGQSNVNPSSSVPQPQLNPQISAIPPNIYSMLPPPSYYQGAPPAQYMELLKKMFDFCFNEVRQVRNEQASQNQVLQETLNKFLTMNVPPQLLTQQIPPIPSQSPKDFYSDAKQHREYFQKQKESNVKRKLGPSNQSLDRIPFGESDTSEYYDKSLSAIASKIPIGQRVSTKEDEKIKQSVLDNFYRKKYKVKPLGKFTVIRNIDQSQNQIPCTSNYLRPKNAKQELKERFEEDLALMKKMQSEKSFKKLSNKIHVNTSYHESRKVKQPSSKLVSANPSGPTQAEESKVNTNFIKKHSSNEDNNILTFNEKDLKMNSPGYSPQIKKQILEQDEYQTEPRVKEELLKGASSLIQQYEEKISRPSKALDFVKMNNQLLSKYEKTEQSKKDSFIKESKDYFSNNQISPVKVNQNYEESLQTIRSDFQSARQSNPRKVVLESVSPAQLLAPQESNQIGYSQTVESVEESSSKFRRPPVYKRKSVGKKKESSISRSKIPQDSQLSKKQNDDSFDPEHPKFDSNVYESQYQESVDVVRVDSRIPPELIINAPKEEGEADIQLYPPVYKTPQGYQQPVKVESQISPKGNQPQIKWKSLQEARKLAKEGRLRVDDSKEYRSVEQKFSELESFMTKKGEESEFIIRQSPSELVREKVRSMEKSKQKSPKKTDKKNIMKLLEQLQDGDDDNLYKQEFESYREQSINYQ